MAATPVIRTAGEGPQRWFYGGGLHTWKVTSDESGGAFFLFEDVMSQGKMTPWHCHPDTDEVIYLLDGEVIVNVAGEERVVTSGGMWMTPRGVPHAFTVSSPTARLLAFGSPATSAAFYWNSSEPANEAGDVDFDRVGRVAADTGATRILGAPPFTDTYSPSR